MLLKRVDRHGTEWVLSAIPLGGYVKMLDEAPNSVEPHDSQILSSESFQSKPVGKRFVIVAAGPFFNLILAVVFYALINFIGTQEPAAMLGTPPSGSIAALGGVQGGDRLTSVNQQPVASWPQARWALLQLASEGGQVELGLERSGSSLTRMLEIPVAVDPTTEDPMRRLGLAVGGTTPQIRSVVEGSVAQAAGLATRDLIISVGGCKSPRVVRSLR